MMNWQTLIRTALLVLLILGTVAACNRARDAANQAEQAGETLPANGGAEGSAANQPQAAGIAMTESNGPQEPTAPPTFTLRDVAQEVGLTFTHGAFRESLDMDPVAMMGGGLCWLDFDQDGWLDLYVVNSHAEHEADLWRAQGGLPRNALFRNRGDGSFEEVSRGSGADLIMRGNGCVAGDITGNGYPDLYVTADGPNALLINQGNGTFINTAQAAGVDAAEWSTAAAFIDFDGDGLIDIFVGAYIDLAVTVPTPIGLFPQDYYGLPNRLFRNRGDGTFEDVARRARVDQPEERTLGAVFTDANGNGLLDLFVANDGEPNRLYLNQGNGTFTDVTEVAGVGDRFSGMGVAAGDYTGDGRMDLVVTNFDREYNSLYRNTGNEGGQPVFDYATFRMGIAGFGQEQTGWGVAWIDLDLSGHLDLFTAQGKVPMRGTPPTFAADRELIRFYHNRGDGTFREASRMVGQQEVGPLLARGMAVADYDNDGVLDLAIATIGGDLVLLKAEGVEGNWLLVDLPHFAPGAKLEATLPNGRVLVRELHTGSSYLASEEPRFHLGLGNADRVARLTITLPRGQSLTFTDVAANQILRVPANQMAQPATVPLPGAPAAAPAGGMGSGPAMSAPVGLNGQGAAVFEYGPSLAQDWSKLLQARVQADRLSPPIASRIYAYSSIALYEGLLPGMAGYRSLQGQLNQMPRLPEPNGGPYNWPAVASAAVATVADGLFESDASRQAVAQMREERMAALYAAGIAESVLERSRLHGQRLGQSILAWAWTDGYLLSRDRAYTLPQGEAFWVATGSANQGQPLEPYWGEQRPFAMSAADACAPPPPLPFSTQSNSAFYAQAYAVYDTYRTLDDEQRAIAQFWADNPGESATPPGHWLAIANQAISQQGLNLAQAAELHALLSIALADSFISCWQEKYVSLVVRPVTYIQRYIDPHWQPIVVTPPFPEYTSGHSVASAAAAHVLTHLLGNVAFTDRTHEDRGLPARHFASFQAAAEEAAISRLYGGIHYPMAIEHGLTQGVCVGERVLDRVQTR